ncbi:MAG: phage holin family protein [Acidimicrobiia bacterium]
MAIDQGDLTGPGSAPPLPEVVAKLKADFSRLLGDEVALAKVEIKETAVQAAKGAGMVGGGAYVGSTALLLLSFAAAFGLATVMPAGVAFLIVAVVYGVIAVVLVKSGAEKLTTLSGPTQTIQTLKEDVQWAKQQMS